MPSPERLDPAAAAEEVSDRPAAEPVV
jgi:hypothetical protein